MPFSPVIDDITLNVIRQKIGMVIARELIDDHGIQFVVESLDRDIRIMLKRVAAGQNLDQIVEKYPKDWVQAVKLRFAPKWALKRWPVKYHNIYIDTTVIYPQIKIANEKHIITYKVLREED